MSWFIIRSDQEYYCLGVLLMERLLRNCLLVLGVVSHKLRFFALSAESQL